MMRQTHHAKAASKPRSPYRSFRSARTHAGLRLNHSGGLPQSTSAPSQRHGPSSRECLDRGRQKRMRRTGLAGIRQLAVRVEVPLRLEVPRRGQTTEPISMQNDIGRRRKIQQRCSKESFHCGLYTREVECGLFFQSQPDGCGRHQIRRLLIQRTHWQSNYSNFGLVPLVRRSPHQFLRRVKNVASPR